MTAQQYIEQYLHWYWFKSLKQDGMGAIIYKDGKLLVANIHFEGVSLTRKERSLEIRFVDED